MSRWDALAPEVLAYPGPMADRGSLEVICGPMFSGKTDRLIHRYEGAARGSRSVVAVRPARDTRHPPGTIVSHSSQRIPAVSVSSSRELAALAGAHSAVLIDEVQFFDEALPVAIADLRATGSDVIAAGLDRDFRGDPFATTRDLLAEATRVTRLTALCGRCGSPATLTQRLANGRPVSLNEPSLVVGDREIYEPRCERCWNEERGGSDL